MICIIGKTSKFKYKPALRMSVLNEENTDKLLRYAQDLYTEQNEGSQIQRMMQKVCSFYKDTEVITVQMLKSESKGRLVCKARHIVLCRLQVHYGFSTTQAARMVNRTHVIALLAKKHAESWLKKDYQQIFKNG